MTVQVAQAQVSLQDEMNRVLILLEVLPKELFLPALPCTTSRDAQPYIVVPIYYKAKKNIVLLFIEKWSTIY